MDRKKTAAAIYDVAHLTGEFLLRSGKISNEYFDKYRFEADPVLLDAIAEGLAALIPEGTEVIAGLEMGGIPIATMVSQKTGLPCAFVRKKAKEYGTCKCAEGADMNGKKTVIIEDVVTTGGQIILSAEDMKKAGAITGDVLCVILRDKAAYDILSAAGLTLRPLFTMEELKEAAGADK